MPIVDGLTSTKMIRSFEKTHSSHTLSPRAALNHRIPIIAVSASLVERERQTYIDAGFDAWILKPVSFDRLQTLLSGIVDPSTREECLYRSGKWENGGWFAMAQQTSKFEAETKPDTSKESSSLATTAAEGKGKGRDTKQEVAEEPFKTDGANDDMAPASEQAEDKTRQAPSEEGVEANDMAKVKSNSAPARMGEDAGSLESTPRAHPAMVTDEPAISEEPGSITSPPAT